jgi:hypothetical protein
VSQARNGKQHAPQGTNWAEQKYLYEKGPYKLTTAKFDRVIQ